MSCRDLLTWQEYKVSSPRNCCSATCPPPGPPSCTSVSCDLGIIFLWHEHQQASAVNIIFALTQPNKPPYLVLCYMCPYNTPSSACWVSPTFQVFHEYRMQHPVGQVPPLRHIQCIKQAPGIKSFTLLSKEITNTDTRRTRNSFFSPNDILIFLYKIALNKVAVLMEDHSDGSVWDW